MAKYFVIDEQGNRKELFIEDTFRAQAEEKKSFSWYFVVPAISLLLNIAQAILLIMDKS